MRRASSCLILMVMLLICMTAMTGRASQAPTHKLYVKEDDWAEYVVLTARGLTMFFQHMLGKGDKLRFVLVDANTTPVHMPDGSLAFYMEQPLCDIYLNGEKIAESVSTTQIGVLVLPLSPFVPAGDAFWADLRDLIAAWNKTLREEDNCTVDVCRLEETEDEIRIAMGIVNTTGGLFPAISSYRYNCTYDKQTGVLKTGYYHVRIWALFTFLEAELGLKLTATNIEIARRTQPSAWAAFWERYGLYVINGAVAAVVAVTASWLIARRYWRYFLREVAKALAES